MCVCEGVREGGREEGREGRRERERLCECVCMKHRFWPTVDDALRRAAFNRGVHVRFLGSLWNYTSPDMPHFLRSLADMSKTGTYEGIIEAVS